MTITEPQPTAPATPVWVQQHKHLWTGRADGQPIGTIEHGRRFTYIDLHGTRSGAFRTLREAQQAADAFGATNRHDEVGSSPSERVLMGLTTLAAFGTVSLLVAAVPVLR